MVFVNLTEEDKEAFFALLDEYFASRPELAQALGLAADPSAGPQAPQGVAAAAHRALAANPQAVGAAVSAGLARVPKSSPYASAASNPDIASAVGRVAAARASLASNTPSPANASASASPSPRPPPPPRRGTASSSDAGDAPPPPRRPGAPPPGGITTQRKLGDLDTSSPKNMFWGMRKDGPAPPAAPVPPALAKPKGFAPPPVRRGTMPAPRARTPTPEPEEEEEEAAAEGEWAEALYDYASADPNDLPLREGQRVLVTARTSDDWWTGDADGKSGLFPATYVKIL